MSSFVCAKCNTVDNTATGLYWERNQPQIYQWDTNNYAYKGKPLCCLCAPKLHSDGTRTEYGRWHNKFEQKKANEYSIQQQQTFLKS